jgi:hypothetical protein
MLTDEDMGEITKEWLAKFLVPVEDAELYDPDIIRSGRRRKSRQR